MNNFAAGLFSLAIRLRSAFAERTRHAMVYPVGIKVLQLALKRSLGGLLIETGGEERWC